METLSDIQKAVERLKELAFDGRQLLDFDEEFCKTTSCYDKEKDTITIFWREDFRPSERPCRQKGWRQCLWDLSFKYGWQFPWDILTPLATIESWLTNLNGRELGTGERWLINEVKTTLYDVKAITKHPKMEKEGGNNGKMLLELYQQTAIKLGWYTNDEIRTKPQPQKEPQPITNEALEIVKPYFKAAFRGIGTDVSNNYFNFLCEDLQKRRTAKEKATILLLAYLSKEVNKPKLTSFADWLQMWSGVLNCKLTSYKANKLDISTIETQCFYLHRRP